MKAAINTSEPCLLVVRLPWPPAVNNLYHGSRCTVWLAEAGLALKRQRPEPIVGHFKAELVFDRPDECRRDLDGLAKAVLDLLVKHQVVVDDSLCRELRLRWSDYPARKPGGVMVFLEPAP